MFQLFLIILLITYFDNCSSEPDTSKKCCDPLILTPFIRNGQIALVREKSYVTPLLPNIFSHSGYFTVNETTNSNLFFWFFKQSSSEWLSHPVMLWLQGGPGVGSLFGLFTENGPFRVEQGKLLKRKYSWTDHYNVLYIDNPVGAGFSFTNNYYVTTQLEVGQHLFDALAQFFTMFPELRKNKFFICGESYAGKYLPTLGYEIYKRNPKTQFPINLKGIFIENGWSDPENMLDYAEHLHRLGLIDRRQMLTMQKLEEDARILIRNAEWEKSFYVTAESRNNIRQYANFTSLYDYMEEKFDENDSLFKIINDDEFRKTIHAGEIEYKFISEDVYFPLLNDINQSTKPKIEELLEIYPIMFFSGQLDIIVAHYLTSNFINQLHWSGADGYSEAKRNVWYVNGHLAGYYKTFGNLKEALIRNAGHMVSVKHPLFLLDLLSKFVNDEI